MARGSLGQYRISVPSARLVIVRMGVSRDPFEGIDVVDRLTADAVAAFEGNGNAGAPPAALTRHDQATSGRLFSNAP